MIFQLFQIQNPGQLALAIVLGVILAFVGDYLLQTDEMAQKKTKDSRWALFHAFVYSVPFALVVKSIIPWLIIFITHFLIDRYRLSVNWIMIMNGSEHGKSNFGYAPEKPMWMSVWLMIIIDNVIHVAINTFAIVLDHICF